MKLIQADATRLPFADQSFDLVFGSPPYADARTYGIGAQRNAVDWVEFMLRVTEEACRVSKGLVLWVAAGVTRKWNYWPCCEGLMWEWFKRGNQQWRPAFWHRVGIPGSGGKQWLRADIEYVLCFTSCKAAVPWADNTANGHAPKWAPGGDMSYRVADGARINEWGRYEASDSGSRKKDGTGRNGVKKTTRRCTRGRSGGDTIQETAYLPPVLANPGVLIKGIKVGGGLMGHPAAHENEAPFPEKLASWFIRSWCPPGGVVLDPFSGSGTTVAAATKLGRNGVGADLRLSQCQLARRRCKDLQMDILAEA